MGRMNAHISQCGSPVSMSHTLCQAGRANRRSSLSACCHHHCMSTRRAEPITATLCEVRLGGGNFCAASDQGAIRHDNPRKAAAPVLALVYSADVVLLLCAGVILWALILLPRSLIDPWLD